MSFAQLDSVALVFLNKNCSHHFLDTLAIFFADPRPFIPAVAALWIYLFIKGSTNSRITLLFLLVTVGLTDLISSQLLKPLIGRMRPCHYLALNTPLGCSISFSTPSSHAANISAFCGYIIAFRKKLAYFLIPLIIIVSLSRVYAGIHWLSDVLLGWCLGISIVFAFYHLRRYCPWIKNDTAPSVEHQQK